MAIYGDDKKLERSGGRDTKAHLMWAITWPNSTTETGFSITFLEISQLEKKKSNFFPEECFLFIEGLLWDYLEMCFRNE